LGQTPQQNPFQPLQSTRNVDLSDSAPSASPGSHAAAQLPPAPQAESHQHLERESLAVFAAVEALAASPWRDFEASQAAVDAVETAPKPGVEASLPEFGQPRLARRARPDGEWAGGGRRRLGEGEVQGGGRRRLGEADTPFKGTQRGRRQLGEGDMAFGSIEHARRRLGEGDMHARLTPLWETASRVAVNGTVVIVSTNAGYEELLENWALHADRIGLAGHYIIFAAEHQSYEYANNKWPGQVCS
ncbi:hypothetical protein CLOM_g12363, partial [Closterium sp. NIES-68]